MDISLIKIGLLKGNTLLNNINNTYFVICEIFKRESKTQTMLIVWIWGGVSPPRRVSVTGKRMKPNRKLQFFVFNVITF